MLALPWLDRAGRLSGLKLATFLAALAPGDEVVITRDGAPVGRLTRPPAPPKGVPVYGRAKGMLVVHAEDDEHLNDFAEYMP